MTSEWVQKQLAVLGELNASCSQHLSKLLRANHGIRMWLDDDSSQTALRGTAIFAAYDPWDACLRVVPNSFKYFHAADKLRIINLQEGLRLSRALIRCCLVLRPQYRGRFSSFFDHPEVAPFFSCSDDDQLLNMENRKGAACPDVFYQAAPYPVRPDHHLVARTLRRISVGEAFPTTAFTATIDAIEFACWGPWIGFKPKDLCDVIASLQPKPNIRRPENLNVEGLKMMIPFFSQGFQGIVVGFFIGINDHTAELVRTELLQFGQTLADTWSLLRTGNFWENIKDYRGDIKQLAFAIINLVSPVEYIIVTVKDQEVGYKFVKEDEYWAGFRQLNTDEISVLKEQSSDIILEDILFEKSRIVIKLLSNYTVFDRFFTSKRIEMLLRHPLDLIPRESRNPLTLESVSQKIKILQGRIAEKPSIAGCRQLFVAEKISKTFKTGTTSISNSELKRHLEGMKFKVINGYQISSHTAEIQKLFNNVITVEKSANGVNLRWNT